MLSYTHNCDLTFQYDLCLENENIHANLCAKFEGFKKERNQNYSFIQVMIKWRFDFLQTLSSRV